MGSRIGGVGIGVAALAVALALGVGEARAGVGGSSGSCDCDRPGLRAPAGGERGRGGSGQAGPEVVHRRTVIIRGSEVCPPGSAYGGMTSGSSPGTVLPGGGTAIGGSLSNDNAGSAAISPGQPDLVCPTGLAAPVGVGLGFGLGAGSAVGAAGATTTLP